MSVAPEKQERFHFLDGLRGVAATMVVIHHALTANVLRFCEYIHAHWLGVAFGSVAAYGVNLFFVLSGVVLLRPYLRQQRKFKLGQYFSRRFTRIYPPYFVALAFGALVIWFINKYPTWYNIRGIHISFTWHETLKELFIVNLDGGYYNLAWWSLGVEVLFYLLVPFVILLYPVRKKLTVTNLIITVFAGVAFAILLQQLCVHYAPWLYSRVYVLANTAMFVEYPVCFLMGILIAAEDFSLKQAYLFFAMALVLIIGAQFYLPVIHSAYGLIFGGVIILAFNMRSLRNLLDTPFMIWLGERSYSFFLVHFSVFYFVDNMTARITTDRNALYAVITRGVGIPLALFVAMLLFHFVEKRFARGLVTGDMFWPWQAKRLHNIEKM